MPPSLPATSCLRCRARIPEAGAQRICGACVAELLTSDTRELLAQFEPGDRVSIVQGVFAGQTAVVVSRDEENGVVRAKSLIMNIPLEVEYMPWQLKKE